MVTEDVSSGTIAVPHGWGHNGGWQRANTAGGANSNDLASPLLADLERLASMSILNGIPVRLERPPRSEEHTSELQSLMRSSYAVFCLKTKKRTNLDNKTNK